VKKSNLKKVLKPLIKECIKEVIFEEGFLSTIISETLRGTKSLNLVRSNEDPGQLGAPVSENSKIKLQEERDRLNEFKSNMKNSLGDGFGDIFENTQPIVPESNSYSALKGIAPNDPGVDLGKFFGKRKYKQIR
jgi:hypothetical protein